MPTLAYAARSPRKGMAATAEAVSCVAVATTFVPERPVSAATSPLIAPTTVPAGTTSGRIRVGISSRSRMSTAQVPVRTSRHWVVVAFVRSLTSLPQSQRWMRSGINSMRAAAASAGSASAAIAASWKIVLIGSSWMPVRS